MNQAELLALASIIKNETQENANTALRLGTTLEEIIKGAILKANLKQETGTDIEAGMSQDIITKELKKATIAGVSYRIVKAEGTPTVNAAELQSVYDAAKLLTPNGAPLSAANRVRVLLLPGYYTFGASKFQINTEFIDFVAVGGPGSVKIDGVRVLADNVLIYGFDCGANEFYVEELLENLICEHCKGGGRSFGFDTEIYGTFIDCEGGSFASEGVFAGTAIRCIGDAYSFGAYGGEIASTATLISCQIKGAGSFPTPDVGGRLIACINADGSIVNTKDATQSKELVNKGQLDKRVSIETQVLSDPEKAQARANIAAQAETDNTLLTTSKTIPGAINELVNGKISFDDLVNDLYTGGVYKALTAEQGVVLANLIDELAVELSVAIDLKVAKEAGKSLIADSEITRLSVVENFPSKAYQLRVEADLGAVQSSEATFKTYLEALDLISSALFMWDGRAGMKTRTVGANTYAAKLYDMGAGNRDASQATEANQPGVRGTIAPNESYALWRGVSATSSLTFGNGIPLTNAGWSITFVQENNVNDQGVTRPFLVAAGGVTAGQLRNQDNTFKYYNYVADTFVDIYPQTFKYKNKNLLCTLVGQNGILSTYIDGVLVRSQSAETEWVIGTFATPAYAKNSHLSVIGKALSASEIQSLHSYLRTQHPEIETVNVGGYQIATSNYEGTVVSDGTVIQEVQNDDLLADVILNGGFDSSANWVVEGTSTISDGVCRIYTPDATLTQVQQTNILTVGKRYKLTYDVIASNAGSISITAASTLLINTSVGNNKEFYFVAKESYFSLKRFGSNVDVTFDNVRVQEVGWRQSTNIYDSVKAYTTGTTEQKEIAALKAAAMWCYYDNDPTIGAWAGKLYNWYAVALINRYAPEGYHVPTSQEWAAVATALGGTAVAGGKMKKEGLVYWNSPNTGATNESGLSVVAGGYRETVGSFLWVNTEGRQWSTSESTETAGTRLRLIRDTGELNVTSAPKGWGFNLRLFSNTPAGDVNKTVEATTTVNFAVGTANFDVTIPWRHVVENVTVNSPTGIMDLQCVLRTGAGADLETLFSAKTVVAGVQKTFAADADQSVQRVDAVLRFNGVKADIGAPVNLTINLKKV